MSGSSWKVAYADFVTGLMAFFLLMWLLANASEEQLIGVAGYFTPDATARSNILSSVSTSNNDLIQYPTKIDDRNPSQMKETETSEYAIARAFKQFLLANRMPSASSGIAENNVGVLLHITSNLMFKPGTVEFTADGEKALEEVVKVMRMYKVYVVVRGHADSSETGRPYYVSNWELSGARASAAVRYLISRGVPPGSIRSVAYADTRPVTVPTDVNAVAKNSRVEFYFHRPEVTSMVVGY